MCRAVGWDVVRLVRVAVGPLRLGRLAPGRWRPLTRAEVRALREAAGLSADGDEPAAAPRGGRDEGGVGDHGIGR